MVRGFGLAAAEKHTAQGDIVFTVSIGQQTIVTYLDKAGRQNMEQESSDKFFGRHRHDLFLVAIGVITPAERNLAIFKFEDTLIADGYPVGITAKILQDSLSPIKGGLAIDDPLLLIELPSE